MLISLDLQVFIACCTPVVNRNSLLARIPSVVISCWADDALTRFRAAATGYRAKDLVVEADASTATYFAALAAVTVLAATVAPSGETRTVVAASDETDVVPPSER